MKLNFTGEVYKAGGSWVVTIPKALVDTNIVPVHKELSFTVELPQ